MFPFAGQLIDGPQSYVWLSDALPKLEGEASFCSAFLKEGVLIEFSKLLLQNSKVRILARWQIGDLLANASDLDAYTFSRKMGWDFYIKLNFHGKVFWVPNSGMLVGSANATLSGFGLKVDSNSELGTVVEQSENNVQVVRNLFSSAIKVDDSLYERISSVLKSGVKSSERLDWPADVLRLLDQVDYSSAEIFISECFSSDGNELLSTEFSIQGDVAKDLSLLGIPGGYISRDAIVRNFLESKLFKWTLAQVSQNPEGARFGAITSALHLALLEDPSPHRKDVKELVKNLYSWIRLIGPKDSGLEVYQPNVTEILRFA
jgi:hypothetical protein